MKSIEVGQFRVSWINEDTLRIQDNRFPRERSCLIHGGDMEGVLDGLVTSYQMGIDAGLARAKEIINS